MSPARRCVECGASPARPVVTVWPSRAFLCSAHVAEFYKRRRRKETARLVAEYGAIRAVEGRADAHHIALGAETLGSLVCSPQADDVRLCLDAMRGQAVRYFVEFEDQAFRVFPSYKDRQRARGHAIRAEDRAVHRLAYDVPYLRRLYRDRCVYCGEKSAHMDHVWPLKLGGDDAPWNLVPACADCNLSKGAKTLGEWLPGRLEQLGPDVRAAMRTVWREWSRV